MDVTLELIFKDAAQKSRTISLQDPKEDLKRAVVLGKMQGWITNKAFLSNNGLLAEASNARTKTIADLVD